MLAPLLGTMDLVDLEVDLHLHQWVALIMIMACKCKCIPKGLLRNLTQVDLELPCEACPRRNGIRGNGIKRKSKKKTMSPSSQI